MTSRFEDKFDAVIFDMDGTILDSMAYWRRLNREFLAERGLEPPEEIRADLSAVGNRAAARLYADKLDLGMTVQDILTEYQRMMAGCYQTEVRPKPHVRAYLHHLKGLGKRICVGTATPLHLARPALARHGLLEEFEFVFSAMDAGLNKEDPAFYREIARRLGVPVDRCAMFEDALYAMKGARAAGMLVMGIEEPVQKPHQAEIQAICDVYVRDFLELCV